MSPAGHPARKRKGGKATNAAAVAIATFLCACAGNPRNPAIRVIHEAPFEEREPAPSPDGRRLAFLADSDSDGASELWISDINGAAGRRIPIEGDFNSAVAWRPDAKRLVGAYRTATAPAMLMEIDPDRGFATPIETEGAGPMTPAISHDGRRLAYAARSDASGELAIWLAAASGGDAAIIAPTAEQSLWPRFMPDGESVVFFSRRDTAGEDDELYLYDGRSGAVRRLTSRAGHDFTPAPSPDGRYLAFVTNRDGRPSLHVMDLSNGHECRYAQGDRAFTHPAWSPDGERLFVTARRDDQRSDIAMLRFSPKRFRRACR